MAGDVIFVHSGILHSGIPEDCVYQCIVFDGNTFLKHNSVCAGLICRRSSIRKSSFITIFPRNIRRSVTL